MDLDVHLVNCLIMQVRKKPMFFTYMNVSKDRTCTESKMRNWLLE